MNIILNGKLREIGPNRSLAALLVALELADKRVAVEVNGEIVPRSQHATYELASNDEVEIVIAVGGG